MQPTFLCAAPALACLCLAPVALARSSQGEAVEVAPSAPAKVASDPAVALAPGAPVESAPRTRPDDGLALGFALHRFQDDFGFGGLVATPTFLAGLLRVAFGGGVAWYPHALDDEGHETWQLYGHSRAVLEAGARIPSTPLRLYGFGGVTTLFVPGELSSKKVRLGGVGGFGFEFRFQRPHQGDAPVSYFAEFGGIGTGATADRLPTHPIFANGFLLTTGLRAYF